MKLGIVPQLDEQLLSAAPPYIICRMANNIQIIIAYDGTRFLGWQKTRMGPSIQEELETAIGRIGVCPVQTEAASRTDRGVHAKGQVVHFRTDQTLDLRQFQRALRALLPREISIQSVRLAEKHFHPTLNALDKEYHYHICNGPVQAPMHRLYSWHVHHPLDIDAMRYAARDFLGTHDFSSFANEKTGDSIRSIGLIDICPMAEQRVRNRNAR